MLYLVVGLTSVSVGFVAGFVASAFLPKSEPIHPALTDYANKRFEEGRAQGFKEGRAFNSQDEKAILELGRKLEEENKK